MSSYQPHFSSYQPHHDLFADTALAERVEVFVRTHVGRSAWQVHASAHAGRVWLRGSVPTARDRQLVERCARHVAGVLGVISEIAIRDLAHERSSQRRTNVQRVSTRRRSIANSLADREEGVPGIAAEAAPSKEATLVRQPETWDASIAVAASISPRVSLSANLIPQH